MRRFGVASHVWRLFRVGATFARSGAAERALEVAQPRPWVARGVRMALWPLRFFGHAGDPAQPPMARALTALGPAYVKLGQALSTRPDLVGPDLAEELRQLQDRLAPFPFEQARAEIAHEFGAPVEALFARLDPPVAAASIAQVHRAETTDGRDVAVKVLRPGVEERFFRDIDAMLFASRLAERLIPSTRRLRPVAVTENFAETTRIELDLRLEAAAASEFAENTRGDPEFRLPQVDWSRTSRRVLTSDWIDATPISDVATLRAQGRDLPRLAESVIQAFLRHALRDGFFHADMHHGNLRVDGRGAIVALDFGIMGRLDPLTRRLYAEILLAFLERDYARAARIHREAGYLPADQPVDAFAQALRSVGEPIFGLGAANISMGRLLAQLFQVTEQFGMETQTQLILLQKTMIMMEGVARTLDPDVNMWRSAKPVVEEWMRANLGPEAATRDLRRAGLTLAKLGPRLPELAERLVRMAETPPAPPPPHASRLALGLAAAGGALAAAVVALLL